MKISVIPLLLTRGPMAATHKNPTLIQTILLLLPLDLGIYPLLHLLRVLEGNIGNLVLVDFLGDRPKRIMI